jgi:xylulokinase
MVHEPEADWWDGSVEALQIVEANLSERRIRGIGVAGLFPAVCLIGDNDEALGSGILYGDGRAVAAVAEVERRLGISLTGDEAVARLLWLRERLPAAYGRARVALGPAGFVGFRLTGVPSIDPHSAVRWGGIVDAGGRGWDSAALEKLGIDERLLAPIRRPHDQIGAVTARAARATGLPEGTPVITGTTDSLAAMLGDGAMRRGDAMIYYGSSGTLLVCTVDLADALGDQAVFGPDTPYRLAAYALDSGRFLEKLHGAISGGDSFMVLDAEAARRPPGSCGLLVFPHVSGRLLPLSRPGARGAIAGLSLGQTRGDLWRATLESFGFILMQAQGSLSGIRSVTAAGGGAVSDVWRSIVSDMTGWTQEVAPPGGSARGAAFLAAYGLGGVRSLSDIRDVWIERAGRRLRSTPSEERHLRYVELLPAWERLDEALVEPAVASPLP